MENEFEDTDNINDNEYEDYEDNNASDDFDAQYDEDTETRGKKIRGSLVELCIYVAVIVLCFTFVPKHVLQRTIVSGSSMMDTLKSGENLLVEKVTYNFADPKRFDVIVFYPHGRDSEDYYIKRVIGLPGETIQIIGETIYINGEELKENYGKDPIVEQGMAADPIKLKDDEFFVLGDNRTVSEDSRFEEVGPVKRENIEGRAIFRIYPFNKFGTFD